MAPAGSGRPHASPQTFATNSGARERHCTVKMQIGLNERRGCPKPDHGDCRDPTIAIAVGVFSRAPDGAETSGDRKRQFSGLHFNRDALASLQP